MDAELREVRQLLAQEQQARQMQIEATTRAQEQLQTALEKLSDFDGLGANSVAMAKRLRRLSSSHPLMAKTAKKIFRLAG
jgi:hypothetical protein